MTELIERLKAARGPNRILDKELAKHFDTYRTYGANGTVHGYPAYTSSIDRARMLIPAGHEFSIGDDLENNKGWAKIGDDVWDECMGDVVVAAATIELAICIAVLELELQEND